MKGTKKSKEHTETKLISFDTHRGFFNQKRINIWEHIVKMASNGY